MRLGRHYLKSMNFHSRKLSTFRRIYSALMVERGEKLFTFRLSILTQVDEVTM